MAKGKGDEGGYGEGDNVHSGPGSKGKTSSAGGSGAGRAAGPSVSATDGGSGRSEGGAGASATEKTHDVQFAEGGDTKMFGEQAASTQRPGYAEKPDQRGPGDKFIKGGSTKMFSFAGSLPATAGISAARES